MASGSFQNGGDVVAEDADAETVTVPAHLLHCRVCYDVTPAPLCRVTPPLLLLKDMHG